MSDPCTRVVLHESVNRDQIDDAVAELGWQLTNIIPASEQLPGQLIYATADRQGAMYLVEDGRLGLLYFTGSGESLDRELDGVREGLRHYSQADILQLLTGPADEPSYARAIGMLALTASEQPNERQLEQLERALTHDSTLIRGTALVAATYAPWPGLKPVLVKLATSDSDLAIRGNAQKVLEALYS